VIYPQPIQDGKELREFAKLLAKFPSSRVGALNLRSGPALNRHQCGADRQLEPEFPTISFRRFGQFAEQLERVGVMTLSLDHRVARGCPLACYLEIFDRFVPIVGSALVMRKFRCDLACAFAVSLFLARCDPAMQLDTIPGGHPSVEQIAIQSVMKAKT
jgi:hypothetical protein